MTCLAWAADCDVGGNCVSSIEEKRGDEDGGCVDGARRFAAESKATAWLPCVWDGCCCARFKARPEEDGWVGGR